MGHVLQCLWLLQCLFHDRTGYYKVTKEVVAEIEVIAGGNFAHRMQDNMMKRKMISDSWQEHLRQ